MQPTTVQAICGCAAAAALWCVGSALADINASASTTAETTGTIVFIAILQALLQGNAVNFAAFHSYLNGSHSILVNPDPPIGLMHSGARRKMSPIEKLVRLAPID
jgi:hypothetical protein